MANKIIEIQVGSQKWIGVADDSASDLALINAVTTVVIKKSTLTEALNKKVEILGNLQ